MSELKAHLSDVKIWKRGAIMLLLAIVLNICLILVSIIMLFQFLHRLVSGETNEQILNFSKVLTLLISELMNYLTFMSDSLPFPLAPLPEPPTAKPSAVKSKGAKKTSTE